MSRVRAAPILGLVGALVLLGGGVASASPPGPNPYAGIPEPLQGLAHIVLPPIAGFLQSVWNMGVAVLNTFSAI